MANNVGDANTFDDNGYALGDAFGNPIFHSLTGTSSPVGVLAPTVATYFYQTNGDVWYHSGSGGSSAWSCVAGQYVWSRLGSFKFDTAANASSILTIPARDILRITTIVTGYSGNGIASLRFGGVAGAVDSGNNYSTLHATGLNNSNKWDNYLNSTSTNLLRLAQANAVLGRSSQVIVSNYAADRKVCHISTATEYGGAGTDNRLAAGQGVWGNTTQQILSVQLLSTANNLTVGSGFIVEGVNLL